MRIDNLRMVEMSVSDLATFVGNPRRGDVEAIADSLRARGQYKPIVVNVGSITGRPNEVLAGNHTLMAARSLEWPSLRVVLVDVDGETAAQIVAGDNRIADLGSYDDEKLLDLLREADDLTGTGYSDVDLARLLRDVEPPLALTDPDDAPDRPAEPVSRPGDVWQLGEHRLVVGSSGDTDLVRSAALGHVDCVWTDPPYGVNYVGGTGMTIQNDGADEAVAVFRDAVRTALAVCRPGAPMYVAHSDVVREDFATAMREAGIRLRQTLIWVKDSLVMGRADYHWQHEPIFEAEMPADYEAIAYGFAPGGEGRLGRGGENWHGGHKSSTVFQVPRPRASREHPTMKPVPLVQAMLENSCPPGGLVFDPFSGSGSTLIAAHGLGMRSLVVELDPVYADVTARRFEEHTGVIPLRGRQQYSFAEVAA